MHTYMLILRVISIRIHFLMVDTDYSKSLFLTLSSLATNQMTSRPTLVLCYLIHSKDFLSGQVRKQIKQQEQSYFLKPAMVAQVLL